MIKISQIYKMIEAYQNDDMNGTVTELTGYEINRIYVKARDLIPENPLYNTEERSFKLYHIENLMIITHFLNDEEKIVFYLKKDKNEKK